MDEAEVGMTDKINQQILALIQWEPIDDHSCQVVLDFLNRWYPQAKWCVRPAQGTIEVTAEFDSPQDATFYMLKWS